MVSKKFFFLFSILMSVVGTKALAYDVAVENADGVTIYYNYISDGAALEVTYKANDYNSYSGSVVIPEEVSDQGTVRKVTGIGMGAFYECYDLASVTLPTCVTTIGDYAFGRSGLTSLTIPASVTSIGYWTLQECNDIDAISVEAGNTKYDSRNNCNAIIETETNTLIAGCKNTVIPASVTAIGEVAFYHCDLTSITIPAAVTTIGAYAFMACTRLPSVTLPDGLTSIGKYAFGGCRGLTSITIPNSASDIGEGVFIDCTGLTSITLPEGMISIPDFLLQNCSGLTSFTFPSGVTSIGESAFYDCTGLTSITFPAGITRIASFAFDSCTGLTAITIPSGVTIIEDHVFNMCSGLTSVTLHDGVTSIGSAAFSTCERLTSITLPASLTSIDSRAFWRCENLMEVISKIEEPFTIKKLTFDNKTVANGTLYVPAGTIAKYQATEAWNTFANIKEGTPSSISQVGRDESKILKRYTIDGNKITASKNGINIIQMENGVVKKVVVRK